MSDDLDRERDRRLGPAPVSPLHEDLGCGAFVGQVVAPAPTAVGQFFNVNPVSVLGTETAGGPGTLTVDTSRTVPVYLVGPGLPSVGANLVCKLVEYRWAAEYSGCFLLVRPLDGYGNPIYPATVTVYWDKTSDTAYSTPSANDTNSGPYTITDATGVRVPVDPAIKLYDVHIEASGYATTDTLTSGCGAAGGCSGLLMPPSTISYLGTTTLTQGPPPFGLGTYANYPVGGSQPQSVTFGSSQAWWSPFLSASGSFGTYSYTGKWICLYFNGCTGYIINVWFGGPYGEAYGPGAVPYAHPWTWGAGGDTYVTFNLLAASLLIAGTDYWQSNINSPFYIGHGTALSYAAGVSPTTVGTHASTPGTAPPGLLSAPTGTVVFPGGPVGVPTYA